MGHYSSGCIHYDVRANSISIPARARNEHSTLKRICLPYWKTLFRTPSKALQWSEFLARNIFPSHTRWRHLTLVSLTRSKTPFFVVNTYMLSHPIPSHPITSLPPLPANSQSHNMSTSIKSPPMPVQHDFIPVEIGEMFSTILQKIESRKPVSHLLAKPPVRIVDEGIATPRIYSRIDIHVRRVRVHCHGDCAWQDCDEEMVVDSVIQDSTRNSSYYSVDIGYFRSSVWYIVVFLCLFKGFPALDQIDGHGTQQAGCATLPSCR